MTKYKLAVIGNPIMHSLSPQLFAIFAKQCNIQLTFDRIIAKLDNFNETVRDFFNSGGKALAVTSPFKQLAYKYTTCISDNALHSGSANLLYLDNNGKIVAENTDGIGLVKDFIDRLKINLSGESILLLGGGGVIGAIIPALFAAGVKNIGINIRDANKIWDIKDKFPTVSLFDTNNIYTGLINTTPNLIDNQLFEQGYIQKFVYDMSYSSGKTICIQKILQQNNNLLYSNGLGMLVMQAYYSFMILFELEPDVKSTYLELKESFYV